MTLTSRMRSVFALLFALVALVPALSAQTAAPAAGSGKGPTGIIRGHVADPTGALIPGARITIVNAAGVTAALVTADSSGAYQAAGLPAGSYSVKAVADGFSPAGSQAFQLLAGQSKRVDIAMAILAEQQSVTVTDEDNHSVSVEAENNASSMVIKDKDLDALSDDPDELSNELSALAGPAAGPNGGEIYVGGFSGGQLPPKSAIREIRVNQNPYSAEFDHLGYGRIEILTKPGTDQLHGRFFMQGNDDNFNTGNPFTSAIAPYHSVQYNGNVSGSIGKTASYFFNVEQRNNQNASVYKAYQPAQDASGTYYIPKDANGNAIATSGSLFNPSTHTEISPRIDVQMGPKHTVTARYEFERFTQSGSISGQQLPNQSTSSSSIEHTLQVSDSWVINDHFVNETRVQYRRSTSDSSPVSTAPSLSVAGSFSDGGSSGQTSRSHGDSIELWNITTTGAGRHALKFGTRFRWNRDASWSNSNYNGSFSFSSLTNYVTMMNDLKAGKSWAAIAADGGLPIKLTYTVGPNALTDSSWDMALFLQDDIKVNQFLTLSGGLRWETQDFVSDKSDFGPRVAFAYALDGHKKGTQSKTVLRGGYGFFYDRFDLGSIMNIHRNNGDSGSQTQYAITNPTCFSSSSLTQIALSQCGTASSQAKTLVQITPHYKTPYTGQVSLSIERQLTKTTSLSITGLRSYGVHQMVTRNANAYMSGTFLYGSTTLTGTRPDPTKGIVQEYDSQGIYKQNQLIANLNARISPKLSFSGFYNLSNAHSITGTVSNSWDLKQDYRRSSWRPRNMVFLMGNYAAPWGIMLNPFLIAQSGRPYNFISPYDLTGDNFFNNRPSVATTATCSTGSTTRYVQTKYGCFDMKPDATEAIVSSNLGNGPSALAFNLRVSRSIGVGPKLQGEGGAQGNAGPGGGHGGGMGMRGMMGPMGGPGGGRGGMMSGTSTGRKYSLTFSAQALNLFNNISYGQPVGTVNSSSFGKSTGLAGGIFSTSSAARRVFVQAALSF